MTGRRRRAPGRGRGRGQGRGRLFAVGAAAAVLALIAAVAAVAALTLSGHRHAHQAAGHPSKARTQQTLLLGLAAAGQPAVDAALLAADPSDHTGSVLLLPAPTLAAAPGYGDTTVGGAFHLPSPGVAAATVSDLLGVTVDHTWRLTPVGLRDLVNRLGQIRVHVDVPVIAAGRTVVVPAGTRELDGAQAAAYAGYLAPGEAAQARPPRLQAVLDAILGELPRSGLTAALAPAAGRLSPATLARFLRLLAASSYAEHQQILPVLAIDTGAATPSLRIDPSAAQALIGQTLADSIPPGRRAGPDRVLVYNNVGTPGLGLTARARLDSAGLDYVGSSNETPFGSFRHSVVLIFNDSAASRALGSRVAAALGLRPSAVKVSRQANSVADAIAVLGPDYRP